MAAWDDINENFQQGGEAWATLGKGLDQNFLDFLASTEFSSQSVLDIGCGTNKFLMFLRQPGFDVHGIDSSETAISMTKEALGDESADVRLADMFEHPIPAGKYGLIYSIATIHYGVKGKVAATIDAIHGALLSGGYVFITLPDVYSDKNYWTTFRDKEEIETGTYARYPDPKGVCRIVFSAK